MIIRYKEKNIIGNVSLKKIDEEGLLKIYIFYVSVDEYHLLQKQSQPLFHFFFFFWFHHVYIM